MREKQRRDDIVNSIKVKAGSRRTYFIDVKKTPNDYYLAITETTRKYNSEHVERHRILLYKEDFNKFLTAITKGIEYSKSMMPEIDFDAMADLDMDVDFMSNEEGGADND